MFKNPYLLEYRQLAGNGYAARPALYIKFRNVKLLADLFIALVALEHIYILWLEMFAWTTKGRKTFRSLPPELFEKTRPMAANQGLYNGFLAAGLIWSLFISDPLWHRNTACFFLGCIVVAGVYGAMTVQRSIFFIQALPALIAFCLLIGWS